jgi:hypothetical protein
LVFLLLAVHHPASQSLFPPAATCTQLSDAASSLTEKAKDTVTGAKHAVEDVSFFHKHHFLLTSLWRTNLLVNLSVWGNGRHLLEYKASTQSIIIAFL